MANFQSILSYLAGSVEAFAVNPDVLSTLLPNGTPYLVEMALWDYKRGLPKLPDQPTEEDRSEHKAEMADLIKDIVAFYNAYGGYLVFGVNDKGTNRIVGCDSPLDVGDLNNRLESITGQNIECIFEIFPLKIGEDLRNIGILLIPRRPEFMDPAVFRKAAPQHKNGKRAYNANDVYVRIRDQSRPAFSDTASWRFLYSPRQLSAPQAISAPLRSMRVTIPARDPDLIKFIGREGYLAQLRHWLADRRSPVRLITGVGGLGKTSLAFRFCEEVVETQAGEIERLVWLTAKAKTFSALRGELVEIGRVDFANVSSLYNEILRQIGSHPDWDDADPSTSDVIEAIVEAASIYTCLIVIDDVDSLAADQQRELVHTLSSAFFRTVASNKQPSRILFTSRIDQGVSPANVIKVAGFAVTEMKDYTDSVSSTLQVVLPKNFDYGAFCTSTSGSPLFAASILRLVRRGADLDDAVDRWKGEEGVEVRRFAFEREISELPTTAARLLYAVCLLGETTPLELSQILEMTKPALSASISSLQSFHLVVTSLRSRSEAAISAPDDVVLTKDVLQHYLGPNASAVELACQKARSHSEKSSSRVASSIGRVVALWSANKGAEALIEAEALHRDFPNHADVSCLLASALARPQVSRWAEADAKFALASKQLCSRPELLDGWLTVKEKMEDWPGLYALATKVSPVGRGADKLLHAFVLSTDELIKIAYARHDRARRIELADAAVTYLTRYLANPQRLHSERDWAWNKKIDYARRYFEEVSSANSRPADQIRIFEAAAYLVDKNVYISAFVLQGLLGLRNWWSDVEKRPHVDDVAKSMLKRALLRVEAVERVLIREKKVDLEAQVRRVRHDVAHRAAVLLG